MANIGAPSVIIEFVEQLTHCSMKVCKQITFVALFVPVSFLFLPWHITSVSYDPRLHLTELLKPYWLGWGIFLSNNLIVHRITRFVTPDPCNWCPQGYWWSFGSHFGASLHPSIISHQIARQCKFNFLRICWNLCTLLTINFSFQQIREKTSSHSLM